MQFLAITNAVAAAVAFGGGVLTARLLGAEQFGVVAVVNGVCMLVVGLLDLRLVDAVSRLFYSRDTSPAEARRAYRSSLLAAATVGQATVSAAAGLIGALVGLVIVPWLTASPIQGWWLAAAASIAALNALTASVLFVLRFSGSYYPLGATRLASHLILTLVPLAVLLQRPTLDSYFGGTLLGAIGRTLLVLVAAAVLWRGFGLSTRAASLGGGLSTLWGSVAVMGWSGAIGTMRLLQREADVLLLAAWVDDRETGVYRLARSLTDVGGTVLQDALMQVHFPRLLQAFANGAAQAFRAVAERLVRAAALLGVALLAGEALLLPAVVEYVLSSSFHGLVVPTMALTLAFFVFTGYYPWLWALLTSSDRLPDYARLVAIGILIQYAIVAALYATLGPSALSTALGVLAAHLWLVPTSYRLAAQRWPAYLPRLANSLGLGVSPTPRSTP